SPIAATKLAPAPAITCRKPPPPPRSKIPARNRKFTGLCSRGLQPAFSGRVRATAKSSGCGCSEKGGVHAVVRICSDCSIRTTRTLASRKRRTNQDPSRQRDTRRATYQGQRLHELSCVQRRRRHPSARFIEGSPECRQP